MQINNLNQINIAILKNIKDFSCINKIKYCSFKK